MARSLPSRPNLDHLRHEAKAILKAHRRGDKSVCETLRLLHRFADAPDQEILSGHLALHEVQYALGLCYGFESWNALKEHVEAKGVEKPSARARLRRFSYTAVDDAGRQQAGEVEAQDVDDVVVRVRTQGLMPTGITPEGLAAEETPSLRGPAVAGAGAAVDLVLLQAIAEGDSEVIFECAEQDVTVRSSFLDRRSPAVSMGLGSSTAVLGVLRDMSGKCDLGSETVCSRSMTAVGQRLPGVPPHRAELEFRSDKSQPGKGDVGEVQQHSLADKIDADRYLASREVRSKPHIHEALSNSD